MKTLSARLELSRNLKGRARERCPNVVWTIDGESIATIRTDSELPTLPLADGEITQLEICDDALSRVIDEAAWLGECQRVLAVGGNIRLTLPASGPLAWLDGMNLYRYVVDISKRGDTPDSTLPTGWNRHYSREDVSLLLHDAGFEAVTFRPANYASQEGRMFAALVCKNFFGGDRRAEFEHFPRLGQRDCDRSPSLILTTRVISARKRC